MEIVECGEDSPVNLNKVNFKMIQMQTRLTVADNTGAKEIMCVKVLGGSKRRFASIGDLIVASVKQTIPNSKIKKGSVVKAVIVRTKKAKKRADGSSIHFNNNAAVHLKADYQSKKRTCWNKSFWTCCKRVEGEKFYENSIISTRSLLTFNLFIR